MNNYYFNGPENCQNCTPPVRRTLQPVLVARVYSQPIIEEMSHYTVSLDVDNTCTVSNTRCDVRPICGGYGDRVIGYGDRMGDYGGYDCDCDRPDCYY